VGRFMIIILTFASATMVCQGQCWALPNNEIIDISRKAILSIDVRNKFGPRSEIIQHGTGFLLGGGIVITAKHLLSEPNKNSEQEMVATIGQRQGIQWRLENIAVHPTEDIAIWQLPYTGDCQHSVTLKETEQENQEDAMAVGFPGFADMIGSRLTITNVQIKQITADGSPDHGQSGAPVFDSNGQVLGILQGGSDLTAKGVSIIPIRMVIGFLQSYGINPHSNKNVCTDTPIPEPQELDPAPIVSIYHDSDIVYFYKVDDQEEVASTLNSNSVPWSKRDSTLDGRSNIITCSPDIDPQVLKNIAEMLINAGVNISKILPSDYAFSRRITIERVRAADYFPPLSTDQVNQLTSCPTEPFPRQYLAIVNLCEKGPVDVLVYYWDGYGGKYETTWEYGVKPFELRYVRTSSGGAISTASATNYAYAHTTLVLAGGTKLRWFDKNGKNSVMVDGEKYGLFAIGGMAIELSCDGK